jgi:hypothetical protein
MSRTQRALTSVVAVFGLLAFVCLSWTKDQTPNFSELQSSRQAHRIYCASANTSTSCLAAVKPTPGPIGTGNFALAGSLYLQSYASRKFAMHLPVTVAACISLPLWLVNRSLLI